ncbi:hypothetical protein Tco_0893626 [Tanacetum coccineum]|uniref:Uncharacterized protein n=1 Tax=Tanacetum coccineum TaxID=301880 RepID=A0ABQ5CAW6_9ASTR
MKMDARVGEVLPRAKMTKAASPLDEHEFQDAQGQLLLSEEVQIWLEPGSGRRGDKPAEKHARFGGDKCWKKVVRTPNNETVKIKPYNKQDDDDVVPNSGSILYKLQSKMNKYFV